MFSNLKVKEQRTQQILMPIPRFQEGFGCNHPCRAYAYGYAYVGSFVAVFGWLIGLIGCSLR